MVVVEVQLDETLDTVGVSWSRQASASIGRERVDGQYAFLSLVLRSHP